MPESFISMTIKERTAAFNEFTLSERTAFLDMLSDAERKKFISDIRQQAVKDFWFHEREAILNGESTRDWTPEQIESIMNISESSGNMSVNAGKAIQVDSSGMPIVDGAGNKAYYGHHMVDVSTHPEYAGDWRNIQALDYEEHYNGAHPNHDTKTPTVGYYDVTAKETVPFDVDSKDFTFDDVGYPPKVKSIFKSDTEMKALYKDYDNLTAGEQLALMLFCKLNDAPFFTLFDTKTA